MIHAWGKRKNKARFSGSGATGMNQKQATKHQATQLESRKSTRDMASRGVLIEGAVLAGCLRSASDVQVNTGGGNQKDFAAAQNRTACGEMGN